MTSDLHKFPNPQSCEKFNEALREIFGRFRINLNNLNIQGQWKMSQYFLEKSGQDLKILWILEKTNEPQVVGIWKFL